MIGCNTHLSGLTIWPFYLPKICTPCVPCGVLRPILVTIVIIICIIMCMDLKAIVAKTDLGTSTVSLYNL